MPHEGNDGNEEGPRGGVWTRMVIVIAILVVGFLGVIARVYYLQTVEAEKLGEKAEAQTSKTVELNASRGTITDRNGVELAVTSKVPSIFARPKNIDNPREAADKLHEHLDWTRSELVDKLSTQRSFVFLDRQANPDTAKAVEEENVEWVRSTREFKRYYPLGSRAGQLLGFVGVDNHGLAGVERVLDEELAGGTYTIAGTRDAHKRTIFSSGKPDLQKLQGNTAVLTIDERIQRVAEQAIQKQVEKYNAAAGYAVVLEVETGEVLAMANTPAFDPNRFRQHEPEDWRLRPVTDIFEPGSVFKPFVLAAALQEGTVSLNSSFDCEDGRIKIGKYVVRDSHPHERLTAAEIIQKSSNIGAYKIAQTVGKETLYEYIRDFGFGQRTGVELPGEQPGLVWPPDEWAEVTFANIAFGQGLSATPLQIVRAVAAIANGGLVLRPRVIKSIRSPEGEVVRRTKPELQQRVLSEKTARRVTRAMSLVPLEEGTGTNAALEDFTVAGKTGTAQKVNPETRRYDPDLWVGSFVGFVPAERPDIAVLVMIDEPQKTHYGGVVAAPAFRRIAKRALAVRGVVPVPEEERFNLTRDQKKQARWGGEQSDSGGRESADEEAAEEPKSKRQASRNEESEASAKAGGVPDFSGMTLREALSTARSIGETPDIRGWGRVVSQTPRPGEPLGPEATLTLEMAPRGTGTPAPQGPAQGAPAGQRE